MYWVLLVSAVGGLVVLLRRRERVWPLLATFVMVSVSTLATYGNQRFRVGAEPALVVLAAAGLVAGVSSLRKRLAPA
jgi:asparagine N-glycosylation enzyme membrane subunit Stt3